MSSVQNQTRQAIDGKGERLGRARRDLIWLGSTFAAIALFIINGGRILPHAFHALTGGGHGVSPALTVTMLLNIALVIFGWRRYAELALEIKAKEQAEAQARLLAETDPLTGCLNRRSITPAAEALLAQARARGQSLAYVMVDLDKFKQVNDVHGHAAGDAMLREAANRLRAILPGDALLARLGGDEFACVLAYDSSRPEAIDQIAAAIIQDVARPMIYNNLTLETSLSLGIAKAAPEESQTDSQVLMHQADIAMYQAKKHGRNRHFWFEPAMESELRFRSELESGIRRGIKQGEFVPFYEKQVDLKTGELLGFEMLARWQSPTLGLVGPDIFIPIAEELGVIGDLSESVIAQALEDARHWDPRLTLSVNISPIQLRDPWFAQKLLKLLVEANFPANRLEIEITETCLHENIGVVRSLVTSLKNQGIRISLDDFGTGYSSLSQLRSLPFDRIKIDRSFVSSLPANPESATIIQAITALGEGLGLPITAEGIETEEVLAELSQFGSYKGQGYLYGRPQPAAETLEELSRLNLTRATAEWARSVEREDDGDGEDEIDVMPRSNAG